MKNLKIKWKTKTGPFLVFLLHKDTHSITFAMDLLVTLGFWEQLNGISKLDEMEWPTHIPIDPQNPLWEFCYHNEQYFMFCGTPAHQNRQSRYSSHFMLAITPRWVLEEFHSVPSIVAKIKPEIRKRLEKYDSISIHPDLNSYGEEDNFEWRQYFLHDDETSLSKCPFHRALRSMGNKDKK
ncbi:FPC/CPF motif-containing protein YcgG [Bacillus mesophilus]|nr:FPC/CPF motif-containing protein YcgG [Bacillus mesophilus]